MTSREHAHFGTVKWCIPNPEAETAAIFNAKDVGRTGPRASFFFRGTHNVRNDLQLSHFVG